MNLASKRMKRFSSRSLLRKCKLKKEKLEFLLWCRENESDQEPCRFDPWPCSVGEGSSIALSCSVGCRRGLNLVLLCLWCRPAAVAPIQPLAWELPPAAGAALKKAKKKKKRKRRTSLEIQQQLSKLKCVCFLTSSSTLAVYNIDIPVHIHKAFYTGMFIVALFVVRKTWHRTKGLHSNHQCYLPSIFNPLPSGDFWDSIYWPLHSQIGSCDWLWPRSYKQRLCLSFLDQTLNCW